MSIKIVSGGYVQKKPEPKSKTSAGGKSYNVFQIGTKCGKDKDGKAQYAYLMVKDFSGGPCPEPDKFVEVVGSLSVSRNEKDGKTYTNLDVMADAVTIEPPRDGGGKAAAPKASEKDPWE